LGEEQLGEIYGIKNNPKDVKWDQFVTIPEFCGLIVENPKLVAILWFTIPRIKKKLKFLSHYTTIELNQFT
jgi:hypothetical protein